MSAETGPKNQISERRRTQNKQAQKNYRERQRRNLQVLQDIAGSRPGLLIDHINKGDRNIEPGMGICTNASPEVDGVYNASLTRSHSRVFTEAESRDGSLGRTGQSRGSLFIADDQHQLFPVIGLPLTSESSQERGIIGQLLQQAGLVLDEKTRLQILEKKIDLRGILKAGLKALSHETLVDADCSTSYDGREGCATNSTKLRTDKILVVQNANKEYMASVPDIPRNNIRIKQVLFVAACVANASSLGLSLDGLNCDSAESPFFRNSVSELAATAILVTIV